MDAKIKLIRLKERSETLQICKGKSNMEFNHLHVMYEFMELIGLIVEELQIQDERITRLGQQVVHYLEDEGIK